MAERVERGSRRIFRPEIRASIRFAHIGDSDAHVNGFGARRVEAHPNARSFALLGKTVLSVARATGGFPAARSDLQIMPCAGSGHLLIELGDKINRVVAAPVHFVDVTAEVSAGHPSRCRAVLCIALDVGIRRTALRVGGADENGSGRAGRKLKESRSGSQGSRQINAYTI